MKQPSIRRTDILLPAQGIDPAKWAVVAVDQFTSQPEYWHETETIVGDAPSTLRLTLPEVYLSESEQRTPKMQAAMRDYLDRGLLSTGVRNGYVLVERTTETGVRVGLMAALDLETYDFTRGAQCLIRPTEGTVIERVPPRVKIRKGACMELPHVLMLLDDAEKSVLEPLYASRASLETVYDFDLMQGGGHLRGWRVDGAAADSVDAALDALYGTCGGLFLAVGDGNHSLAAARQYWLDVKAELPESDRADHPARFALAEIENLHSDAIQFEPIHRVLTNVDPEKVIADYEAYLAEQSVPVRDGGELTAVWKGGEKRYGFDSHPLRVLQNFLDGWLKAHPEADIDYIHGDDTLRALATVDNALGLMPCSFGKGELFPFIREHGVLPRKTFSMGHAHEKRYYFEARKIEK